jgi:hypothetical protein
MNQIVKIKKSDLHPHIKARMLQRGISIEEIEETINQGWIADDAQKGTYGRVFIFPYNEEWEGKFFEEKEVTVYYKYRDEKLILLTAKARYGKKFSGEGGE